MASADDLPKYYIIGKGKRPVKIIGTDEGGLAIYALGWKTGEFALAMYYLAEIDNVERYDIEEVSEEEFDRQVEDFRKKIKEEKSK